MAIIAITGVLFYIFKINTDTSPIITPSKEETDSNLSSIDNNASSPNSNNNSVTIPKKIYNNSNYEFSFSYPKDMNARIIKTGNFDVVVVEGSDSKNGFQIIVSQYYADALTLSDLNKQLRGVAMNDVKGLTISYNSKGFIFHANNPSFEGSSIEAWFVHDNKLYQVSSYARNENLVMDSLATWEFRK